MGAGKSKLKVGWFSFSCCEDSTIIFTELLNDHFQEWKRCIDFRSILVLQKKEDLRELDVAFIEGAIASSEQEKKLLFIRSISKKLVAIGNCACVGMPSSQRNRFDDARKKEISPLLEKFSYAPFVKKVSDVVSVDASVSGCPMSEEGFLSLLDRYLKEFGIRQE